MSRIRYIERTLRGTGGEIDLDVLKRKSWPGIAAEFVRFAVPSEFDFRLAQSTNFLTLLNIYRADGDTTIAGMPRSLKKDLRNKLTFVPSGAELRGWACIEKPSSCMSVYFDGLPNNGGQVSLSDLPPILEFEDHMLRSVMMQIQSILHDPSLDTPGYAETLGTLLAFEMGRFKSQSKDAKAPQGGLTARQVRHVIDYLETRLTDKTTIAELSALVDLSRFHFIRAFKKTVGMPPHQFVVHRRVERARELLHDPQLSVSEVATRTGFNSTTHFTKSFRRITGTTPTSFRRDVQ
jgi:AraC family transcriptional regulator